MTQQFIVTTPGSGTTAPAGGAIINANFAELYGRLFTPNVNPSNTAAVNTTNLQAAVNAAAAAGGGIIQLGSYTSPIQLSAAIDMTGATGVIIAGSGVSGSFANDAFTPSAGTILQCTTTAPAFSYNSANLSSALTQAAFTAGYLSSIAIKDLAIDCQGYGLQFGGTFNPGLFRARFSNITIFSSAGTMAWGSWIENFQELYVESFNVLAPASATGTMYWGASSGNGFNPGNSAFFQLSGAQQGRGPRGIVFQAHGGDCAMNDIQAYHVLAGQENGTAVSQAATMTNGSSTITVTNGAAFPLDMPVTVSATENGFTAQQTYFVTSQSGNNLTLANTQRGATPITANAGNAVNLVTYGWPPLEICALDTGDASGNLIQASSFVGVDAEGGGTTMILAQGAGIRLEIGTMDYEQGTKLASNICARSLASVPATLRWSCAGFVVADFDAEAAAKSICYGATIEDDVYGATTVIQTVSLAGMFYDDQTGFRFGFSATRNNLPNAVTQGFGATYVNGGTIALTNIPVGQMAWTSSSTSLTLGANRYGAGTYIGSSAATWTLQTISGTVVGAGGTLGMPLMIYNASASVLTVVGATTSQPFGRLSGDHTATLAGGAYMHVIAQYDGTNYFWQPITLSSGVTLSA